LSDALRAAITMLSEARQEMAPVLGWLKGPRRVARINTAEWTYLANRRWNGSESRATKPYNLLCQRKDERVDTLLATISR